MSTIQQNSRKPTDTVFGRYELLEPRLTDVNGEVWKAVDTKLEEDVDIRFPRDVGDHAGLLADAVERASELSHPGVLRVFRAEVSDGEVGIVLEPFEGESLATIRARRPRKHYEFTEIRSWVRQLLEAVIHIHESGNVHGAVNTTNVLVSGQIKLAGLATSVLWQGRGGMPGSTPSLSPQILDGGQILPADDVYAVAALLYDLLTGQPVFNAGDIAMQIAEVEPETISERLEELGVDSAPIPKSWEDWVAAGLSKERVDRPDLNDLLTCLEDDDPVPQVAESPEGQVPAVVEKTKGLVDGFLAPENRKRSLIIGGAVGLVAMLGILMLSLGGGKDDALEKMRKEYTALESGAEKDPKVLVEKWNGFLATHSTSEYSGEAEWTPVLTEARAHRDIWQGQVEKLAEEEKQMGEQERLEELNTTLAEMKAAHDKIETDESDAVDGDAAEFEAAWSDFLKKYAEFDHPDVRDDDGWKINAERKSKQWAGKIAAQKAKNEQWSQLLLGQAPGLIQAATNSSVPAGDSVFNIKGLLNELGDPPPYSEVSGEALEIYNDLKQRLQIVEQRMEEEDATEPLPLDTIFAESKLANLSASNRTEALESVQRKLIQLGHLEGTANGKSDEASHGAIIQFQRSQGLVANGKLDDEVVEALQPEWIFDTYQKIDDVFLGTAYADHSSNGRKRHFEALQEKLKSEGVYQGSADMKPGPGTHRGIKDIQTREGELATGQLTDSLLAALELTGRIDDDSALPQAQPTTVTTTRKTTPSRTRPPRPTESRYCGTRGRLRLNRDRATGSVSQSELKQRDRVRAWDAKYGG